MHFTVHCVTYEHGTNLKFGNLTLQTWSYSWKQFYVNKLNTLWVVINWKLEIKKGHKTPFRTSGQICCVSYSDHEGCKTFL